MDILKSPLQSAYQPSFLPPVHHKNRSLTDWFVENQCIGSENMQKDFQQHTFRDNDGMLRYMQNWLPAPEEGCSYLLPGSYELSLSSQVSPVTNCEGTAKLDDAALLKASVKILFDWQLLWRHFANDNFDELAIHDDLLRASIDFFMHKRTMYIYWILFIYIQVLVNVIINMGVFNYHGNMFGFIDEFLVYFIGGLYYLFLQRLYMGSVGVKQPGSSHDAAATTSNQGNRFVDRRPKYMHWSGSLRHFFHLAFSEARRSLCCCGLNDKRRQNSSSVSDSKQAATSFNQLMNIALKYLHIHCEINPQELDRSRRIYKLAFLCLFAILLIMIVVVLLSTWIGVIVVCTDVPQNCNLQIINAVLTGGYIFYSILFFLLFGSVIVGVIGLSYGTTLAYFMAASWIKRYAGLRRIEGQAMLVDTNDVNNHRSNIGESMEQDACSLTTRDLEISRQLRRDAMEQYLFMAEYMHQCGSLWSPVIVAMYCFGFFQMISFALHFIVTSSINMLTLEFITINGFISFQIFLFLGFPSLSLASANVAIAPVAHLFMNCSSDDFAMMGGRDAWLSFVTSVPAAWTVYGLWITFDRIAGAAYTVLTAGATLFITLFLPSISR